MSVISMLQFSFSLCSCGRVDVSAWPPRHGGTRNLTPGASQTKLVGVCGGASGITQEALRLEEGHHRRRGKVWRAKSTGASGVMVQGCENWGRSKVWGKWQRTLWPPEPLVPGVVSPWPGSPWSSLQNMFSVPFSSEHGMEGDLVFISIVHMKVMVPQDTARKWHSRDLNLDSFFRKCLLFSWHLTVSVIAGW